MKTKIWVTSDLYLGQKAPFGRKGFETKLLRQWNKVVAATDVVLILGNVAEDKVGYWFNQISGLPGVKTLLLGSDDKYRHPWYKKWSFIDVVPIYRAVIYDDAYGPIMFTHLPAFRAVLGSTDYPKITANFERLFQNRSCILNIHGHMRGHGASDRRCFDASLEATGEMMLTLDQIQERAWQTT